MLSIKVNNKFMDKKMKSIERVKWIDQLNGQFNKAYWLKHKEVDYCFEKWGQRITIIFDGGLGYQWIYHLCYNV